MNVVSVFTKCGVDAQLYPFLAFLWINDKHITLASSGVKERAAESGANELGMNIRKFLIKPFRDVSRKWVEEVGSEYEGGFEETRNSMRVARSEVVVQGVLKPSIVIYPS